MLYPYSSSLAVTFFVVDPTDTDRWPQSEPPAQELFNNPRPLARLADQQRV
jgi:hypothetical protein